MSRGGTAGRSIERRRQRKEARGAGCGRSKTAMRGCWDVAGGAAAPCTGPRRERAGVQLTCRSPATGSAQETLEAAGGGGAQQGGGKHAEQPGGQDGGRAAGGARVKPWQAAAHAPWRPRRSIHRASTTQPTARQSTPQDCRHSRALGSTWVRLGRAQMHLNACSKSAQMSSTLSMPQEKRMRLSLMPTCARFSGPWSQ